MKKYKLLISDIDGTIIPQGDSAEGVSKSSAEAVSRAQDNGAHVSLATGRKYAFHVADIASKLKIQTPVIADGGSIIVDPVTDEIVWNKPLSKTEVQWVYRLIEKYSPHIGYVLSDYANTETGNKGKPARDTVRTEKTIVHFLESKVKYSQPIVDEINASDKGIVAHLGPSWRGPEFCSVDIVHEEATKQHSVERLARMLNIEMKDVIVLGDSANDAPMFEVAGFAVAVGNATNELKELADYMAPNQEDGALAHVIEKFLLN